MKCCTGRCFLISLFILQLLATIERQVFDFLGYMWTPIAGNFLQIVFIIMGIFGVCQYRPRFIVVYAVWCLVWLGWNIFVICLYLEVGTLTRANSTTILNIGTGSKSWWLGIGCEKNTTEIPLGGDSPQIKEEDFKNCVLAYYYIEVIQAGVQCILSLIGFIAAVYVVYVFSEEDDSSPTQVNHEMDYIKMRYKSPARNSFRSGKNYDTVNHSNFNTLDILNHVEPQSVQETNVTSNGHANNSRAPGHANSTSNDYAQGQIHLQRNGQSGHNSLRRTPKQPKKSSSKDNVNDNQRVEQLPWVRISPSPAKRGDRDSFRQQRESIRRQRGGGSSGDESRTAPSSRDRLDFDDHVPYMHQHSSTDSGRMSPPPPRPPPPYNAHHYQGSDSSSPPPPPPSYNHYNHQAARQASNAVMV